MIKEDETLEDALKKACAGTYNERLLFLKKLFKKHQTFLKKADVAERQFIETCTAHARRKSWIDKGRLPKSSWIKDEPEEVRKLLRTLWGVEKSLTKITEELKKHGLKKVDITPIDLINAGNALKLPSRSTIKYQSASIESAPELTLEDLDDFLIIGRTMKAICEHFSVTEQKVRDIFQNLPLKKTLHVQQNAHGQDTYFILKEFSVDEISNRKWVHKKQINNQPYVTIDFPDSFEENTKQKELRIIPISDVMFGDISHDKDLFNEYIQWIRRSPGVYVIFVGNIFKRFQKRDESEIEEIVLAFQNKIKPIAHKILCGVAGVNEEGTKLVSGIYDPLQIVCTNFAIPHYDQPVYLDAFWRDHRFTFFVFSGRTHAITEGGKINAAAKLLEYQEHVDFLIMGKVKDQKVDSVTRLIRDYENFKIVPKNTNLILCPGFQKFHGSSEEKRGYPPPSTGTVSCILRSDGKSYTST